jgi:hypothetical protein
MFMKLNVLGYKLGSQMLNSSYSVKREANSKFFEWMNKYALIPFINEIKADNSLDDDAMSGFQLDGEAVQIETFTTKGTQHFLESNKVVCGKPPGQTSKITQACDDSDLFRGPKGKLPYITIDNTKST